MKKLLGFPLSLFHYLTTFDTLGGEVTQDTRFRLSTNRLWLRLIQMLRILNRNLPHLVRDRISLFIFPVIIKFDLLTSFA